MSILIKTVTTRKELKTFSRYGNKLYKGNKYYVPTLIFDDLNTLDKNKNAAFDFCEAEYYLAYRDGEIVGRVAAIVNHKANESWQVKQVRFGWFDFIDDIEDVQVKSIFEYRYLEGMTQTEVGEKMGFDRSRISRKIDNYLKTHTKHKKSML